MVGIIGIFLDSGCSFVLPLLLKAKERELILK